MASSASARSGPAVAPADWRSGPHDQKPAPHHLQLIDLVGWVGQGRWRLAVPKQDVLGVAGADRCVNYRAGSCPHPEAPVVVERGKQVT